MHCKPIDKELDEIVKATTKAIRRAEKLLRKLRCKAWVQIAERSHYLPDENEPNVMEVRTVAIRLAMHADFATEALCVYEHVDGEDSNYKRVDRLLPLELMRVHDALPELIDRAVNESVLAARRLQAQTSELNSKLEDLESNPIFRELLS